MRNLWLVLALTLSSLAGGCASDEGAYSPAGTEAVVSVPNSHRMLARVPNDQKIRTGGRNWVAIESGTRVLCLENLNYHRASRIPSNPDTAVLRVRMLEGTENGLELLFPHESLSLAAESTPRDLGSIVLMFGLVILAFSASHIIAAAAKAVSRRRDVVRHWIESHPGERLPGRRRRHRLEHGVPSARVEDQTEWAAWLASRNARSRNRMMEPASCCGK